MKRVFRKIMAWVLCLCMAVTVLPTDLAYAMDLSESSDTDEDSSSELIEITDEELEEILGEEDETEDSTSEEEELSSEDEDSTLDDEESSSDETSDESSEDASTESSESSEEASSSEEDESSEESITPIEDPVTEEDTEETEDTEEDTEDTEEETAVVTMDVEEETETVSEDASETTTTSYDYATELAKFPSSYQTLLAELHEEHEDWIFVAVETGLDWDDAVAAEQADDKSLITTSASDLLKSNASGDYNTSTGSYITKDSSSWVTANSAAVAYYMDPRNFLTEEYIFMFECLSFDDAISTSDVEAVLSGTFMSKTNSGSVIKYYNTSGTLKTINKTYSSVIYSAGETYDVNPVYLAAKIRQEVGTSGSGSTSGTYTSDNGNASWAMYNGNSLDGYYNFYNIGASSSTYPITNGLAWAAGYPNSSGKTTATSYSRPWTTPVLSITYGAQYIANSYISVGQDTSYFMRFNVYPDDSSNLYSHQYMTNISGAATESYTTYSSYNTMGILDDVQHIFYIPVYEDMPDLDTGISISGASTTATISADGSNVNMRAEPSSAASLVTSIPDGTSVTIVSASASVDDTTYTTISKKLAYPYWFKVKATVNGKTYTGYVCAEYLDFSNAKTLTVGNTTTLKLTSSVDGTVYYQSSDPSVATVSSSGKVTAVSAGTCEIYAYYGNSISAIGIKVKNKTATSISSCTISSISSKAFTGSKIKPTVTIKNGSTKLVNGTDYTVSYSNNLYPGTATVTITGIGNYTGTVTKTFKITGTYYKYKTTARLNYRTGAGTSYTKKGTLAKNKTVNVLSGYSKTKNGYTWVIVKINGSFYYVASEYLKASLASATVSSVSSKSFTGSKIKPSPTVKFAGTKLKKGTDYTLSYSNNLYPGTATITITGKGNYTGSTSITFKITGSYTSYKTTANLNYRSGAGTSYTKKGTLSKGTTVKVLNGYSKKANGYTWVIVKINSKYYYVAKKYLKKVS